MNLKLNTIYTPLTYDELVKPLIDYGKAYKEAEAEYSTLAAQAEAFKDEANKETSREAFDLYNKYSTDLSAAMEDFNKGMTAANRRKLVEMKRRYAGEIIPIAKASEALKEANAFRDKLGPDAIFKVGRYNSLDNFLHGKTADNSYVSAKQLAAQANAKALTAGPNLYKELQAGGNTPITNAIYDTLWEEAGGDTYDDAGKAQLHEAIMAGINSAAYKLEADDKEWEIKKDAQARAWAQIKEQKRQHNISLQLSGFKLDKDGKVQYDKDSPVWAAKGIKWDDEGLPIPKDNSKPNNKDNVKDKVDDSYIDLNLKPLYFEAWNEDATKGFQSEDDPNDPAERNLDYDDYTTLLPYNKVKGEDAKNYIKNYIKERFNIARDITDDEMDKISSYINIIEDEDPLSDNHFMVYLKGYKPGTGEIVDKDLRLSVANIRSILKNGTSGKQGDNKGKDGEVVEFDPNEEPVD